MSQPDRYQLPRHAYARLIEARDSLRLLDSYVNKTDVLCNPSMLSGYVSMLQDALQEAISASLPAEADKPGPVALDPKEQQLIQHLRWTSREGREKVYALAEQVRQGI